MHFITAAGFLLLVCNVNAQVGGLGKSSFSQNRVLRYSAETSTGLSQAQRDLEAATSRIQWGMMIGAPEVVRLNMNMIRAIRGRRVLDVGKIMVNRTRGIKALPAHGVEKLHGKHTVKSENTDYNWIAGFFTGYSALGAALATPRDGQIIAMDITQNHFNKVNGSRFWNYPGDNVAGKLDLRIAPALQTMNELMRSQNGTFDFCFIDADKNNQGNYYEQCLALLRSRGIITIDNSLWGGAVANPSQRRNFGTAAALHNLNLRIGTDNRVWASLLPIADGLWVIVKK